MKFIVITFDTDGHVVDICCAVGDDIETAQRKGMRRCRSKAIQVGGQEVLNVEEPYKNWQPRVWEAWYADDYPGVVHG